MTDLETENYGLCMHGSTTSSRRKWTKWMIATVLYGVFLLAYLIACFHYGSSEMHIEIYTLVFSTALVYIVLFWTLDEARKGTQEQVEALQKLTAEQISALKDSTKLQIESFSTQSEGIVSALEKVVGAIAQMSEDTRKQMEQEEKRLEVIKKQTEARIRTQEQLTQKDWEKKQRIAPRIFARIASEPFFFVFSHYRLYIYNTGGLVKNIELEYFFSNSYYTVKKTISIGSLDRNRGSRSIDCGDVQALSSYAVIQVSVSLRDKEDRLYVGTIAINKSNGEWVQIPLQERAGE